MFKFITQKPLWVNILVGLGIAIILILIFMQSLDWMTMHGTTLTVPAVTGKPFAEAEKLLENEGFDVVIQDSVYNDTAAPLAVLRQFPDADATVKRNRTVYLTINRAEAPVIEMPNLTNQTYRSAILSIKQYGLNLEDTVYRLNLAKDFVIDVMYNGKPIKPGEKIRMGSDIVLVLGSGVGEEEYKVPDVYGMTLSEAKVIFDSMGLTLGAVIPADQAGNPNAYVVRQNPEVLTPDGRPNRIRQGQVVDIWVQTDPPPPKDTTSAVQDGYQ